MRQLVETYWTVLCPFDLVGQINKNIQNLKLFSNSVAEKVPGGEDLKPFIFRKAGSSGFCLVPMRIEKMRQLVETHWTIFCPLTRWGRLIKKFKT